MITQENNMTHDSGFKSVLVNNVCSHTWMTCLSKKKKKKTPKTKHNRTKQSGDSELSQCVKRWLLFQKNSKDEQNQIRVETAAHNEPFYSFSARDQHYMHDVCSTLQAPVFEIICPLRLNPSNHYQFLLYYFFFLTTLAPKQQNKLHAILWFWF